MGAKLQQPHILIVEDEMLIGMLVETMVEDLGYRPSDICSRTDAALSLIDKDIFQAAILDVNLEDGKVWPVADALARAGVPFAFASGDSERPPAPHADRPVLAKPFRFDELRTVLHGFLAS